MAESSWSSLPVKVAAGVLTAGVVAAIAFVPELYGWISSIVFSLVGHLSSTTVLPNWVLYLLAFISIPFLGLIVKTITGIRGPRISQYTKDSFLGLVWRWGYTFWDKPEDIWAFCPRCDTSLIYSHEYPAHKNHETVTRLFCETCNRSVLEHDGDKGYLVSKIYRQIDRKIRTKEWISVVKNT